MLRRGLWIAGVLGVMALSVSGCKTARLVSAKTALVRADRTFSIGDTGILHESADYAGRGVQDAAQLRHEATAFMAEREKDLTIYGPAQGPFKIYLLAVSQNQPDSTFPKPTEFAIFTTSDHRRGETTHSGYAEIRFGSAGPVYTTDIPGGYFELQVSDVFQEEGDTIASGTFSMIAKNKNDAHDTNRLFVLDGAFITRVK